MTYTEKYILMKEWVSENIVDVSDLVSLLDITIEDVVNVFPDKLVENYGKVYTQEESDDSGVGEEGEDEEEGYFDED